MDALQGAAEDGLQPRDSRTPGEALCERAGSRQQHRGFLADPEAVDPRDARLGFEEASVEISGRVRVPLQSPEAARFDVRRVGGEPLTSTS